MQDIEQGYICTGCGQYVKAYRRKINSSMAQVLILMRRHSKQAFFHVEDWLKKIGKPELRADYHKLRMWNLIEAKKEEREDGSKRNGYYRITGRGIMFAEGKLNVPEAAVIFNNKLQRLEGNDISIQQALGNKFNYNELMGKETKQNSQELSPTLFQ